MNRFYTVILVSVSVAAIALDTYAEAPTVRSSIIDLNMQTKELTQLTKELHATPIADIRKALAEDFEQAANLRNQLQKSPGDVRVSILLEGTLSKVLSSIDDGLRRLLEGEEQVMRAVDDNLVTAELAREAADAKLSEFSRRASLATEQRRLREAKLRTMLEIYGSVEALPEDVQAIAQKIRLDIKVCQRLERVLAKSQTEQASTRDSLAEFVRTTRARKVQLGNTYHAAIGHRHVIAHLVEYRATRLEGEKTRSQLSAFNQQLRSLMQGIRDLDLESVVDVSIDDFDRSKTSRSVTRMSEPRSINAVTN
ncbi:hypothetical protein [Aporhodopirellula aestuarii]|uniref:Uncharacterized protein n=1 Tax=Aporhodopirellula aestuarii TaxID=2950107 RepID=A0ABT0UBZ5_9BACT|nr:hypothetical protein [Aporhodopirellula aestuarii]MCM2374433.1 hypothetical protein [Aporhodopirellula aestuarii]